MTLVNKVRQLILRAFSNKALILITLLALFLRLFGIWHGWPFIYNVDEPALVRSAVGIRFAPNPGHFDWPHFHFYLSFFVLAMCYFVRGFLQVVGARGMLEPLIPFFWTDPAVYYLIVRVFNATLGALTVIPIYLSGKELRSRRVGLLAALALALLPFHVKNSHLATVDVPMVFWLTWSVYFSTKVFRRGAWLDYLLAGVFAGLATSTKYNGVLILVVLLLAHLGRFLRKFEWRTALLEASGRELLKPVASGFLVLVFFFLGTPYALMDFKTFWSFEYPKGALWQFQNVGSVGSLQRFLEKAREFFLGTFPGDFSLPFYLIFIWSLLQFLFFSPRSYEQVLTLIFPVFYIFVVMRGYKYSSHYFLPVYPFIALVVGQFATSFYVFLKRRWHSRSVVFIFFSLLFLPALYLCLRDDVLYAREDTRTAASCWVDREVESGAVGAVVGAEDIEIVKDGVKADHFKNLSIVGDVKKYDFIILATKDILWAEKKLAGEGFDLALKISSKGHHGPDVYIFSR